MLLENSKGRSYFPDFPMLKIGKVTAVHRAENSVDLVMLTGEIATHVSVMCSMAGSNFGTVNLVAPTTDVSSAVLETGNYSSGVMPSYGRSPGSSAPDETGGPFLFPPLEQDQQLYKDPNANRDIYAAVMPVEGNQIGINGMLVIGFIYPQQVEMMFDSGSDNEMSDFFLYRHPSDVQVTIDRNGFTSIQHPSGARLTIGDLNAVKDKALILGELPGIDPQVARAPYTAPSQPDIDAPVDLSGLDINRQYALRANLGQEPGVILKDAIQSQVRLDGRGDALVSNPKSSVHLDPTGNVTITDAARSTVVLDGQGRITVTDAAGDTVVLYNDAITVTDNSGDTIAVNNGAINVNATNSVTVRGATVQINGSASVTIDATTAEIDAALVNVNGALVRLGGRTAALPVAYLGSTVICPAGTGYVTSGSLTVLTTP
jgi:flagellar basal body rod protein FlgF